ncbi:NUDIX hydrolase [Paenibacillus thermotolerans]|uniref:NUDIX hydrolase n=1 Tax=Paenibacillus thermotolerans TaxID=3027807 RepID=UPI0023681392|nr:MULTISPECIES: NUDIX domain-containing protein [unclassified Paenibacillus]
MQLIKRITDHDINGDFPSFIETVSRYASRGVLIDDDLNVAMMYMSNLNLYKLPGGGVDEGENRVDAFLREIKEETGYEADLIHELGYIEEHKKRNDYFQLSYCYVAKARNNAGPAMLTEEEIQLGMTVKWMKLDEAVELMNRSAKYCEDYSTKFMLLRDIIIIKKATEVLYFSQAN